MLVYFVNARTVEMIVEMLRKATPCDCNDFYTMQRTKFCIVSQLNGWNGMAGLTRKPMSVIMTTTTYKYYPYGYCVKYPNNRAAGLVRK